MLGPVMSQICSRAGSSAVSLGTEAPALHSRALRPARLDPLLHPAEIGRDEPLGLGQGLTPDVIRRHPWELRAGYLDVVATDAAGADPARCGCGAPRLI